MGEVSVMPVYTFKCDKCGRIFTVVQSMNDDHTFTHCGKKCNRVWCGFETNKDLMYQFTTDMFDGKGVDIHSRAQYKSLLKKHGMADATVKEIFQERRKPRAQSDKQHKKLVKSVRDKMRGDGVLQHLPSFCKLFK